MTVSSGLFELGLDYFQATVAELQRYGVAVSPMLELYAADGLMCYYHLEHQVIYLSLPDRDTLQGKLQMLLLRSLLACDSNAEVIELLQLVLHWLVVHEIAHHVRHYSGLLSTNVWQEEQIANQLAIAISKPQLTKAELIRCQWLLTRATDNLAGKLAPANSAVDSYRSLVHSLNTAGFITTQTLQRIERMHDLTGVPCETILRMSEITVSTDIDVRLRNRSQIIEQINTAANQDIVRYLYYYFGWMNIGLMSGEACTIHEFAERYLKTATALNC